MSWFRVMVHGKGINVPFEGADEPATGFFTTRVVRAVSDVEARKLACEAVLGDWTQGDMYQANRAAPPTLEAEKVTRVTLIGAWRSVKRGYTFYSEQ